MALRPCLPAFENKKYIAYDWKRPRKNQSECTDLPQDYFAYNNKTYFWLIVFHIFCFQRLLNMPVQSPLYRWVKQYPRSPRTWILIHTEFHWVSAQESRRMFKLSWCCSINVFCCLLTAGKDLEKFLKIEKTGFLLNKSPCIYWNIQAKTGLKSIWTIRDGNKEIRLTGDSVAKVKNVTWKVPWIALKLSFLL